MPFVSSTAPPVPAGPGTQSPTPAVGVLAWRSPSMPNPPAGTVTGATPVGGGTACALNPPKRRINRQSKPCRKEVEEGPELLSTACLSFIDGSVLFRASSFLSQAAAPLNQGSTGS